MWVGVGRGPLVSWFCRVSYKVGSVRTKTQAPSIAPNPESVQAPPNLICLCGSCWITRMWHKVV